MENWVGRAYREGSLADDDQRPIDDGDAVGGALEGLRLDCQRIDVVDDLLRREGRDEGGRQGKDGGKSANGHHLVREGKEFGV